MDRQQNIAHAEFLTRIIGRYNAKFARATSFAQRMQIKNRQRAIINRRNALDDTRLIGY